MLLRWAMWPIGLLFNHWKVGILYELHILMFCFLFFVFFNPRTHSLSGVSINVIFIVVEVHILCHSVPHPPKKYTYHQYYGKVWCCSLNSLECSTLQFKGENGRMFYRKITDFNMTSIFFSVFDFIMHIFLRYFGM